MKIVETENEISLTNTPIFLWFIGSFFSALLFYLTINLILTIYSNPQQHFKLNSGSFSDSIYEIASYLFLLILLLISAIIFLLMFILSNKVTVKIKRQEKIVEIIKKTIIRKKVDKYEFHQVKYFDSSKMKDANLVELVLVLANEKKIQLEMSELTVDEAYKHLEKLNSFFFFNEILEERIQGQTESS